MGKLPEGTVTILLTDVEGSTALHSARGDDVAREILGAHGKMVRGLVADHGGVEVKSTGDGLMAAFTSVRRAVTCAVAIQRACDAEARRRPEGAPMVRIGLNTGDVTEEDKDLHGAAVNAAARIAAKARGGQILVSSVVKDLAGGIPDASFASRGRYRLKGFPQRWQLFEVAWHKDHVAADALQVDRAPLLGRDAEREQLVRALSEAAEGRGGLVMIGGEPGIGKTRLAEELRVEATRRGFRALIGHCVEHGGTPYLPVVEILESAVDGDEPETLRATLRDAAPEVARLVPRLRRIFPDMPPPLELPPEHERRQLFNSIRDFFGRAGAAQPQLMVLDDLQWADDATLALLRHLAERIAEMPILLIGTYRDVDLDAGQPLSRTLEDFLRRHLARLVHLDGLSAEAVAQVLQSLAGGQKAPPNFQDVIYAETEGNPFFVEEVFQHLLEEGVLLNADGRWRSDVVVADIVVPESVRTVIDRRLERLTENARVSLTVAAVVGRKFSYRLLEATTNIGPDDLLDAIDMAERARLIAGTEENTQPSFVFTHELIRQTLLARLSLPRRQRLHVRVADALEQIVRGDPDQSAAEIAQHLLLAGEAADPGRAAAYLLLAGDQAVAAAAYEEALKNLERARELSSAGVTRARILGSLGLVQRSLGQWEAAFETWEAALATYEALGDMEAAGHLCWRAAQGMAWTGKFAQSLQLYERGLGYLGDVVTEDRARLLAGSAGVLSLLGQRDEADSRIRVAASIAGELHDDNLKGYASYIETAHQLFNFQPQRSLQTWETSESLVRGGDPFSLASTLAWVAWAAQLTGRFTQAEATATESDSVAHRAGNYGAMVYANRVLGQIPFLRSGDLQIWAEFVAGDLELCDRLGTLVISDSHTFDGLLRFWQGDWEDALEQMREGETREIPGVLGGNPAFVGLCLAYLGRFEEAQAIVDLGRQHFPVRGAPAPMKAWTWLACAVETLSIGGADDACAELFPLVRDGLDSGAIFRPHDFRLLQTVAGMAATAAGDWTSAEAHFAEAGRQAQALPAPLEAAEVARFHVRMLERRRAAGDGAVADRLRKQAADGYARLGMKRHQSLLD